MVFHWSLSDSKSPRDSRTLLSILADLNNAVVWMVSTCPLISKSSNSCTKILCWLYRADQLQIVSLSLSCSIVFSIIWQGPGIYPSFRFLSLFYPIVNRNGKFHYLARSLFCWVLRHLVVWPRLGDPFVSQPPPTQKICVSFFKIDSWLCIYNLFVWLNFNFLHDSQWITFPPSRV